MLEPDSPVLADDLLSEQAGDFYLVGIIGGKNVGKSALVNALVGRDITLRTSTGRGTDRVIAYAHQVQESPLRRLLEREVPGQFEIVVHEEPALVRQVLLDLPDFDSHYTAHLDITRRMLRHMLFPVWLQSIEKYADRQPRELLQKVTAGNDPRNFIFCLNKVDQLEAAGEWSAAEEIRRDFAERLQQTLDLSDAPRVWMISGLRRDAFELPDLRDVLMQQRSEAVVSESRQRAVRRQASSLVRWIDGQQLPERFDRLRRLEEQAHEELTARVAAPIVETTVAGIVRDPGWAASVSDDTMRRRVARWPVLSVLHLLLEPLLAALRGRVIPTSATLQASGADVVGRHLGNLPTSLSMLVQGTFAQLQQSSPLMSQLYASQRLWDTMSADQQAGSLRARLVAVLETRAEAVRQRFTQEDHPLRSAARFLVTIGAALWFVALQPVLEMYLSDSRIERLVLIFVQVFSVAFLLKSLAFLAAYFVILWMVLRWRTQQQVEAALRRGRRGEPDLPAQLASATLEWVQDLLTPLRRTREQVASLILASQRLSASIRRPAA